MDYDRPNVTLIFHDASMPIRDILRALRAGLKEKFSFDCLSLTQGAATRADALMLRLHIRARSDGRTVDRPASPADVAGRRRVHCDLLDRLAIPNGTKAIAQALYAHWSDAHRQMYGEPANPATVKRWRAEARRNRESWGTRSGNAVDRRRYDASEAPCRIRHGHAARVRASGMPVKQGYRLALGELDRVNEGTHALYRPAPTWIEPFSYETFRRDCSRLPATERPKGGSVRRSRPRPGR